MILSIYLLPWIKCHNMIPAETLTFRESTPASLLLSSSSIASSPPIPDGMRTNSVQAFATKVRSPWPSEPRTSKMGRSSPAGSRTGKFWRSYRGGGRFSSSPLLELVEEGTDAEAPMMRKPSSLAWLSVRGRFEVLWTSTTSSAPALVALTIGLGGAEFFEHTKIPTLFFFPPKK